MAKKKPIKVGVAVTRRDIEQGRPRSAYRCPVALSLKRRFPGAACVTVGPELAHLQIDQQGQTFSAQLPDKVANWVGRYDARNGRELSGMRFALTFTPDEG